jgi:hypothetical protein
MAPESSPRVDSVSTRLSVDSCEAEMAAGRAAARAELKMESPTDEQGNTRRYEQKKPLPFLVHLKNPKTNRFSTM